MKTEKNPIITNVLNAIKRCGLSRAYLFVERQGETYGGEALATLSFVKDEDGIETRAKVEKIPARIVSGHTDAVETRNGEDHYSETFKPRKGSWCLFYCEELTSAFEAIPSHADVRLDVLLDNGTNQYVTKARLHCDELRLVARWKSGQKTIERRFSLDTTCGAHNSARFGVTH